MRPRDTWLPMVSTIVIPSCIVAILVAVLYSAACQTPLERQVSTAAVDVAIAVCVAEHEDLTPDQLRTACHYGADQEPQALEVQAAVIRQHARIILQEIRDAGLRPFDVRSRASVADAEVSDGGSNPDR